MAGTPANISQTLFNQIRNSADAQYAARIPEATRDNVAAYGQALSTYVAEYNQFLSALINRIGLTIMRGISYVNPLGQFKRGMNPQGHDIQEIFIEPIQSEGAYNPAGPNPLGRRANSGVNAAYHRMDRQDQYCISVDRTAFMQCFTSWGRVDEFIGKLMDAMYTGAQWDEYLCMRQLMTNAIGATDEGKVLPKAYLGTISAKDESSGKAFVQGLKYLVQDMKYIRDDFNQAGVLNRASAEDLVLFINKDLEPNIDVYALTGLFHIDEMAYPTRVFSIDTFGVSDVMGILAHKDWLQCYDTLITTEPQRNAQGLFTNFFYTIFQTLSLSPFMPAIVLYGTTQPT